MPDSKQGRRLLTDVRPNHRDADPHAFLAGGGETGRLIRSMDWSGTPLGPVESWPQSLRTTVNICLASDLPICVIWGPGLVQIYNDGYRVICGGKHPRSLGQNFSECWKEAWPVIGGAHDSALAGDTAFLESQHIFLERRGYSEECFFTFSFSPIRDEAGRVGGLFHPVIEMTAKMLSERRTRALRDLAARTSKAKSVSEALDLSAQALAAPFNTITHSAWGWSYQNPSGEAWPCETIRSMHTSAASRRVVTSSSGNRAGRSAKRLAVMDLPCLAETPPDSRRRPCRRAASRRA